MKAASVSVVVTLHRATRSMRLGTLGLPPVAVVAWTLYSREGVEVWAGSTVHRGPIIFADVLAIVHEIDALKLDIVEYELWRPLPDDKDQRPQHAEFTATAVRQKKVGAAVDWVIQVHDVPKGWPKTLGDLTHPAQAGG
jgi:hypothetical protein